MVLYAEILGTSWDCSDDFYVGLTVGEFTVHLDKLGTG